MPICLPKNGDNKSDDSKELMKREEAIERERYRDLVEEEESELRVVAKSGEDLHPRGLKDGCRFETSRAIPGI